MDGVPNPDFLSLIKDPQSLPLRIPRQPENYIREIVRAGLSDIIINRDIKPLFTLDTTMARSQLVKDLSSIKSCNPKLTNKLYASSNLGLQEKWIGKFSNYSRSIQQTAVDVWVDEREVVFSIRTMEDNYAMYLQNKRGDREIGKGIRNIQCVTKYAQLQREQLWGIEMEGITMAAPQEQAVLVPWNALTIDMIPYSILISGDHCPNQF